MLSKFPKRTKVIHVRMTTADHEAIVNRAERVGRSVSDWVRTAAMHYIKADGSGQLSGPKASVPAKAPSKFLGSSSGEAGA